MNESGQNRSPDELRSAARRALRKVLGAYVAFAFLSITAMIVVFAIPVREIKTTPQARTVLQALLVFFFFAATIINLGIQWAAKIIAARAYSRKNPYPAASVIAYSQLITFAVYAAPVGLVMYYRLVAAGGIQAIIPGVAAVLAGFYFLRLPRFLLQGLYRGRNGGESAGGEAPPEQ